MCALNISESDSAAAAASLKDAVSSSIFPNAQEVFRLSAEPRVLLPSAFCNYLKTFAPIFQKEKEITNNQTAKQPNNSTTKHQLPSEVRVIKTAPPCFYHKFKQLPRAKPYATSCSLNLFTLAHSATQQAAGQRRRCEDVHTAQRAARQSVGMCDTRPLPAVVPWRSDM